MTTSPSLLQQIQEISRAAAVSKGFTSSEAVTKYKDLLEQTTARSTGHTQGKAIPFETVQEAAKDLPQTDIDRISRVMALDSIALNAARFAENAQNTPSPANQIKAARAEFEKLGVSDDDIQESLHKVVVSMVHTAHPTIFHTLAAKRFEKELTHLLEAEGNTQKEVRGNLVLSESGKVAVAALYAQENGFIERISKGSASITQLSQISLQEEAEMEADNWKEISKQLEEIVIAWNEVYKDRPNLQITPEQAARIFEKRTWLKSADADGRDQSTAQFLFTSIRDKVVEGQYKGEKLDLRQNAAVHEDYISSLIQVKYRNSKTGRYSETGEFAKFCEDFMHTRRKHYSSISGDGKPTWYGEDKSIFQQLTPEDRADFVSQMMEKGFDLIPDAMKQEALPNLIKAVDLADGFFVRHHEVIEKAVNAADDKSPLAKYKGAHPLRLAYADMIHVTIPHNPNILDPNDPAAINISLRGAYDAVLEQNGYRQVGSQILNTGRSASPETDPYQYWDTKSPNQILSRNFLQSTRKWNADKEDQVVLSPEERIILNDTSRRMTVLNHAIDNFGGKAVADRYQIANFARPSDFLIAMKLFEESGLITLKADKVTEAKLDIMPLLETETDLENGVEIFNDLLKNPLARSYWKKRGEECGKEGGKATIMCGFSDGAASAGNYASQWAIFKAKRSLVELFAKEGIEVEFLDGRGRGTDRGGTIDPSLQFDLTPPEVTCRGRYDVTIQSDLPMDMAGSPAYGKDYLTKVLLGTVKAYATGKETRDKLDGLKGKADYHIESVRGEQETVLETIAKKASAVYNEVVRKNPDVYFFLDRVYDNNDRSSRAATRGVSPSEADVRKNPTKYFDAIRAIPKEHRPNMIDLPFHHVGLGNALSSQREEIAENNVMQHPFMQSFLRVADAGMQHFDPAIAKKHGETVNLEGFVNKVIKDLSSLVETAKRPLVQGLMPNLASAIKPNATTLSASGLDQLGHALILNMMNDGGPKKPNIKLLEQEERAKTLRHLLKVTSNEVGHRFLAPLKSANIGRAA